MSNPLHSEYVMQNERTNLFLNITSDLIRNGDQSILNKILEKNQFLVYFQEPLGVNETLLHYVARYGSVETSNRLINLGANINAENFQGRTPLFEAIKNNAEMVKLLVNNGANLKIIDKNGVAIFQEALNYGSVETVHFFLSKLFSEYISPEEHKIQEVNTKCKNIVKFLLSQKVDPNYRKTRYSLLSYFVLKHWDEESFKLVLQEHNHINVNDQLLINHRLYQRAFKEGRLDIVKHLFHCNIDIHCKNEEGDSLIHHAVCGLNTDCVDFLLHKGLGINIRNNKGLTPLHQLINMDTDEIIPMLEFIVDNRADIEILENEGVGILQRAIELNRFNVVECLLELKSDIKSCNFGERPFECFCLPKSLTKLTKSIEILIAFMVLTGNNIYHRNLYFFRLFNSFIKKCRLEFKKLKKKNICDKILMSFYDFLFNDLMKVTLFANSRKLMHVLDVDRYKLEFPCFAFLLEKRTERVKAMLYFRNATIDLIKEYAKVNIPIIVTENILHFLRPKDFRNVARAMSLTSKNRRNFVSRRYINNFKTDI